MRAAVRVSGSGSRRIALALVGIGLASTVFGFLLGLASLFAGWLLLASTDRRYLTLTIILGVPLTTFSWNLPILELSGRTLDVRLVINFAVAGIALVALVIAKRVRPTTAELLFVALIAWSIISGIVASDSYLTWGPPVARFVAYASMFALGRRYLLSSKDLAAAMTAVAIGFALPTVAGLAQYFMGQATFINDAARATAPGGRGPISLAFEGQVVLLLAFALFATSITGRWRRIGWIAAAIVGGGGVLASATRLVTVTAWAGLASFAALRRAWPTVVGITILFGAAFFVRPELLGRFLGTVSQPPSGPTQSVAPSRPPADQEFEVDPSVKFRLFVWSAILQEWTEHPVTGIGPGMTARVIASQSTATRAAPHNDYLGIFAELSLIGIALYLALQIAVLVGILRNALRVAEPLGSLLAMVGILFVSVDVLGVLNNPIYFFDIQVGLWALVGAALVQRPSAEGRFRRCATSGDSFGSRSEKQAR
jgi:O-antigen ligase